MQKHVEKREKIPKNREKVNIYTYLFRKIHGILSKSFFNFKIKNAQNDREIDARGKTEIIRHVIYDIL